MINTFQQGSQQNNLLGITDITADYIRYILDEDPVKIIELKEYFLRYSNVRLNDKYQIPLGGGIFLDKIDYLEPNSNNEIPGLKDVLEYLNFNYRRIDDVSIINNYYTINKHTHQKIFQENISKYFKRITNNNIIYKKFFFHNLSNFLYNRN